MSFVSRYRTETILFLVAFALHAVFVGAIQYAAGPHGFISYSDAEYFFYRLALNFLQHGALSLAYHAPYFPDAYHTPLYPLFLAGLLATGLSFWGVALVQSAFASATVVLTYLIARELTSRRLALGAGMLALLEPMALYWSGILVSDTLFATFFTAAIYALMRRRFLMLGVLLGLAALTRPIALYAAPFFLLMGVYLSYAPARPLRDAMRGPLITLALMSIIIFPWFLHNRLTADTWAFTSAGWHGLYAYPLLDFAEKYGLDIPQAGAPPPDLDFSDFSASNFEYVPFYRDSFFSLVSQNPLGYALVHTKRALVSIFSNRYDYLFEVVIRTEMPALYAALTPVGIAFFVALGGAFWIGIYALVAIAVLEKDTRVWWIFGVTLLGTNFAIAGAIIPYGGTMSRYMLGFHAPLFVFAIVGVRTLMRLRKTLI